MTTDIPPPQPTPKPGQSEPRLPTSTASSTQPPPAPAAERFNPTVQFLGFISDPVVAAFCAGGVAGAVSRTVVSPLERLKILFQVQSAGRDAYKLSVGQGLAKMWGEEGWRGFMRGNGTNCIRIVPYSAVQFGSYNFYKRVGPPHPTSMPRNDPRDHDHKLEKALTHVSLTVFRATPRRQPHAPLTPHLWWYCRYHISHLHLPPGHCPHTTLDPICLIRRARQAAGKAPRHVANHDLHVQD